MQAITVASKLDWAGWLEGLVGAFISGGASAASVMAATISFDPSHDMMGAQLFKGMGMAFAISGVISLVKFLQQHPTPAAPTTTPPVQ